MCLSHTLLPQQKVIQILNVVSCTAEVPICPILSELTPDARLYLTEVFN